MVSRRLIKRFLAICLIFELSETLWKRKKQFYSCALNFEIPFNKVKINLRVLRSIGKRMQPLMHLLEQQCLVCLSKGTSLAAHWTCFACLVCFIFSTLISCNLIFFLSEKYSIESSMLVMMWNYKNISWCDIRRRAVVR